MIKRETLINFLGTEAKTSIGRDYYDNETSVMVEFAELYKETAKYLTQLSQQYAAVKGNISMSAEDYENLQSKMENKLRYIVKKAVWFNGCCDRITGEPFFGRKLNMNSVQDCAKFVKELYSIMNDFLTECADAGIPEQRKTA